MPLLRLLLAMAATLLPCPAADYHVDANAGDDSLTGLTPAEAWKSLEKINSTTFLPGDRILFKSGSRWTGSLRPKGSGTPGADGKPITISRYGDGPLPRIDANGNAREAILLENIHAWQISDLHLTNRGKSSAPWRCGVRISAHGIETMRQIHLRNLHVHDVNGDLRKSHEGCGIFFEAMRGSRFDDLIIEHCHVERTDRNGICQRGHGGPRSTRIIIRNNRLENIGGDGIKLWGTNGGLIEHNTVRNARARCKDHAAGIWPFDSDDTTIQFNTVSHTRGTLDGQSFDSDYLCRRTLIQYNVSHNNEGGFLLVCAPGRAPNQDTIVRYNISVHDGVNTARVIHFGGGSDRALIHNNTFVLGPKQQLPMLLFTDWDGGKARDARFINNLVIVERGGIAKYDFGPSTGTLLENNLFVGRHEGLPQGITAVPTAPPIAGPPVPSENPDWLETLRPIPNRPFPRGKIIENPGTRDFFGTPLPIGKPLAIGAAEPRP